MRATFLLLALVLACSTPPKTDRSPDLLTTGDEAHDVVQEWAWLPSTAEAFVEYVEIALSAELPREAQAEIIDNLELRVAEPQAQGPTDWRVPLQAEMSFELAGSRYRATGDCDVWVDGWIAVNQPEWLEWWCGRDGLAVKREGPSTGRETPERPSPTPARELSTDRQALDFVRAWTDTGEAADAFVELVVAALPAISEIPAAVRAGATDNLAFTVELPQATAPGVWAVPVTGETSFVLEDPAFRGRYRATAEIEVMVDGSGGAPEIGSELGPGGVTTGREGVAMP